MKFLCVTCDEAMKLTETAAAGASGESLSVTFRCPSCEHRVAMLTNPWETEVVSSLGVKIGPDGEARQAASRCPFTGVVQEIQAEGHSPTPQPADPTDAEGLSWTTVALERLENIPDFVRPMAKMGVEQYARSQGRTLVDEKILDEARQRFGM
jgi:hypothetical protein